MSTSTLAQAALAPTTTTARRTITGFTPSGPLHLGALLAVIEPVCALARTHEALVFVCDLHALTSHHDPRELARRRQETAALLIAGGLDHSAVFLQSRVPEIAMLHFLLGRPRLTAKRRGWSGSRRSPFSRPTTAYGCRCTAIRS